VGHRTGEFRPLKLCSYESAARNDNSAIDLFPCTEANNLGQNSVACIDGVADNSISDRLGRTTRALAKACAHAIGSH